MSGWPVFLLGSFLTLMGYLQTQKTEQLVRFHENLPSPINHVALFLAKVRGTDMQTVEGRERLRRTGHITMLMGLGLYILWFLIVLGYVQWNKEGLTWVGPH